MTDVQQTFKVVTRFTPGYGERISVDDIADALQYNLDPNDNDSGVEVYVEEIK